MTRIREEDCYNPVVPAYPIWAYYAHGRQRRCQEDPASLPSSRLEKTTRSSPHHVAQHHPTGSETTPHYSPRSSRFGSEPPSVEDDVDVWCYAILELHARNNDDDDRHWTDLTITGSAVALHCVKAHRQSQWRSPNFNPL